MFNENVTIGQAILIALISMAIVFFILLLIAFITMSFKHIFKSKKENILNESTTNINNEIKNQIPNNIINLNEIVNDELKLVAVLVASIESNKNDEDKKYMITNIREI